VGGLTASGLVQGQDFNNTQFVKGYDFPDGRDIAADPVGHGTHVSGTIAESTDNGLLGAGVAPEAKIMPLRTCDDKGQLKMSAVADALHYAADHGANVANMSLGGPNPSTILQNAMDYAFKRDVTLVCSAGNSGKEGVGYPGRYKTCITVSAVGPGGLVASYSTWGKEVDIAGPGGEPKMGEDAEIWQNTFMQRKGWFGPSGPRVDGFFPLVGTSMAAPHVTGVAALLVSLGMTDPKEIRSQIRKSAKPYAPVDHYGAGVLDAAKATESVRRSTKVNKIQILLAIGAAALLLTVGRNLQRKTDPMFFVHQIAVALTLGLFFPVGLEKVLGFGNLWNLVGHSVILSILFFMTPRMDRSGFWKAFAFTLGVVIHLLLDADSGRTPFLVMPPGRILFWIYANVAVGLYFAVSAWSAIRRLAAMKMAASVLLVCAMLQGQTRTQTIHVGEPASTLPGGNPGRTTNKTGRNSPFPPGTTPAAPPATSPGTPTAGAAGYGCTGSINQVCNAQMLAQLLFERYDSGYPIRIVRLSNTDMPKTWLVLLAGTEFNIMGQSNTPLAWGEGLRQSTNYRSQVAQVITNWAPPGSNIILVGHSLGGMVAQNLAADSSFTSNYKVVSVISYGSPKTTETVSGTDYVWFAAVNDLVPSINPLNLFSQPPYIWVTVNPYAGGGVIGLIPGVNAHMAYPTSTDLANYDGLGHKFLSRVLALVRTGTWPGKCLTLDQTMSWCATAPAK